MTIPLLPLCWLLTLVIVLGTLLSPLSLALLWLLLFAALAGFGWYRHRHAAPGDGRRRLIGLLLLAALLVIAAGRGYFWLQQGLSSRLPLAQDRSRVALTLILEKVERFPNVVRLYGRVTELDEAASLPIKRVRLNWYLRRQQVPAEGELQWAAGDRIRADVVLRAGRRFANPLWFDYEAFQLLQGIDAIGYIRQVHHWQVADQWQLATLVQRARQQWLAALQRQLPEQVFSWVAGLVFAEGRYFSPQQWQLARDTGTLHLLVVSGLHLAIVAFIGVLLAALLRRLVQLFWRRNLPAARDILLAGVLGCCGLYVLLSAGGIAVQRAFLMLSAVWLLWLCLRRFEPLLVLSLVLLAVVVARPLIYTQMGFQLSFTAVAVLLLVFHGRKTAWPMAAILPQVLLFIALIPWLVSWQAPVNGGHLIANLVAIPLMTLVLLPLIFLTALLPLTPLLELTTMVGSWYWHWLEWVQTLQAPALQPAASWLLVLLVCLIAWIWRQGIRFPLNLLGLLAPLVTLLQPQAGPQLIMADVGQGLALIASDNNQALVYDTGAAYSARFDAGSAFVVPLLRRARSSADYLIVSHSDNDHAGGATALLAYTPDGQRFAGQPQSFIAEARSCHNDSWWRVISPQLRFRFLPLAARGDGDNNQSCIVLLDWWGTRLLIPGDIEAGIEQQLVRRYGHELKADILIAPHHGSLSSSSVALLEAVAPQEVWVSSGYNNRFGHPAKPVVARYQQFGLLIRNTAQHGALTLNVAGQVTFTRQGWQRPWLYP